MGSPEWLAGRFEDDRARLLSMAVRMLGSQAEAEDALQESWLRVSRADTGSVENLSGWLTTVVSRVCLDMLRSRRSQREELAGVNVPEDAVEEQEEGGPEQEAMLADSVGLALLMVLDALAPAERVAFVLHDMFDISFAEIAPVVGRTPAAARKLASRGRRRLQETGVPSLAGFARQRQVASAFLAASRDGDFAALLAVLDPDVVMRADSPAVAWGAPERVHGAAAVAGIFAGRAREARLAMIDGGAGLVWAPEGRPRVVFVFAVREQLITTIDMIADPDRLTRLDVILFDG
jgi:RNA polymerase sigma factor (sigma-70 family)